MTAAIRNYTTGIAVTKTTGDIQALLAGRGVTRMSTTFDPTGVPDGFLFEMTTDFGVREFALPVRVDGVHAALRPVTSLTKAQRTREHAARVAWRIVFDWLGVQLALIDAQMSSLEEVMLPYMVGPAGETMYEVYRGSQKAIES